MPLFDNRLQFDDEVGLVPADLMPDIDKDTAHLNLQFNDAGGWIIRGGGVWSETTNRYTGLTADYSALGP